MNTHDLVWENLLLEKSALMIYLGNKRSGEETGNTLSFSWISQWRTSRSYCFVHYSTKGSNKIDYDHGTGREYP